MSSNSKLPQVMIEVFVLCLAPLFAGEGAEEAVNIALRTAFAKAVKFVYQFA